VCLSVCLPVCLPVCSPCPSACPSDWLCVCISGMVMSGRLSAWYIRLPSLSVCLLCLPVCPSVCLSVRMSVCLPVCPYVCLYSSSRTHTQSTHTHRIVRTYAHKSELFGALCVFGTCWLFCTVSSFTVTQYQSIETPDGMIRTLWGPVTCRWNDARLLNESGLVDTLRAHFGRADGTCYALYGEYLLSPIILSDV
jgi:hypothetical protein